MTNETWGDYSIRIGENLKRIRTAKGMNKKTLCEKTGISNPSLTYYEQGKRCMTIYTAEMICKALGIEIKELLRSDEE